LHLTEGQFGLSSRDALNAVRELVSNPRYLKPKSPPLSLPGVDGVRIFVLGPPENETWLMQARPSSQPGEVYQEDTAAPFQLDADESLASALMASSERPLDALEYRRSEFYQPFTGNHRVSAEIVKARTDVYSFFHDHYGFREDADGRWRRIDLDWMGAAESLALKLDSATNNTSLVLAIELQASQRILLFPADAQVGNWKSWHEGGWSQQNGLARGETLSAEDLLKRTVLYKVGHHGSHNATLREQGLEMMTSPELTAMIPVDETWALARKPYPWKMPFDPLYAELVRRTGSRILRSDARRVKPERPNAAWREFEKRSRIHELFVELDVRDD
jgi:hypothetical protein